MRDQRSRRRSQTRMIPIHPHLDIGNTSFLESCTLLVIEHNTQGSDRRVGVRDAHGRPMAPIVRTAPMKVLECKRINQQQHHLAASRRASLSRAAVVVVAAVARSCGCGLHHAFTRVYVQMQNISE